MRAAFLSAIRVTVAVAVRVWTAAAAPPRRSFAAAFESGSDAAAVQTRNDTAATLDYQRMARVVDGVFSAITHPSQLKEAI